VSRRPPLKGRWARSRNGISVTCPSFARHVPELPRDLPILERDAVRVVVRDSDDRILLFHTREITLPELGEWWELPGGGVDEGETYLDAALRELREETGIRAAAAQVGEPSWRRTASFRHRDLRHLQHEVVVEVRLDAPGEAIDEGERLDYEKEDYFGFRWWAIDEILGSAERFYPGRLPALLPRFLAGEAIDEPFELFS
jgi:8-oxo-dGTP pyrophosphatase MutT (NUDIX family)